MAAPPDEVDPAAVVPLAGVHGGTAWHLGDHAVLLPEGTSHRTLLAARLDDLLSSKPAEGTADVRLVAVHGHHAPLQTVSLLLEREQAAALLVYR